MTKASNPFNFADVSDLSAGLQERLEKVNGETIANAKKYAALIAKAGRSVSILEVECAAARVFGEDAVPASATVRKYLNKAVELNLLVKPSRQSYAVAEIAAAEEEDDVDTSGITELLDEVSEDI